MATKKMDESLKRAWVYALRSGEYKQGKNKLCHAGRYCCLGVLTEIAAKRKGFSGVYSKEVNPGKDETLPELVQKMTGLNCNPTVKVPIGFNLKGIAAGQTTDIATLNDSCGATFEQLAGIIETQL